jgi:hypothetical protein
MLELRWHDTSQAMTHSPLCRQAEGPQDRKDNRTRWNDELVSRYAQEKRIKYLMRGMVELHAMVASSADAHAAGGAGLGRESES